ncbi:4-hydroxy-tetrahydrodipicolinate reductase [soil metagenome]
MITILLNGAHGRMGQETHKALLLEPELQLVGELGRADDLATAIKNSKAQVVIDFTNPSQVFANTVTIIEAGLHPVIGTTGLTPLQIVELQELCATKKLGGIIAPNFSIGAVLMMRFAAEAAKYFSAAEIIEFHHQDKEDSPSGTAIKTADMIASARQQTPQLKQSREVITGARGALHRSVPIHAVRLAGIVANQQVIFGGKGETLTIQHNTINREAFMPGVILACKKVVQLDKLVYGLEYML